MGTSDQEVGVARENFVQVGLGVGLLPQVLKDVNGREWGVGGHLWVSRDVRAWVKEARIFGEGSCWSCQESRWQDYDEHLAFLFGQCFISLGTQHSPQGSLA